MKLNGEWIDDGQWYTDVFHAVQIDSFVRKLDETVVLSQCLQGPATNPNGQFSSAIIVASYVEVLLELEQTKEDPETHAQLASFVRTSASC